jgi:hypothetical protein
MSAIEHYRETLRAITTTLENAVITDFVYWGIIRDSGIISDADLKQRVEDALQDPKIRAGVHNMYSEAWKALDQAGTDAFFEDLLKDLPPTDKPN